jgi:hypothetical protein
MSLQQTQHRQGATVAEELLWSHVVAPRMRTPGVGEQYLRMADHLHRVGA